MQNAKQNQEARVKRAKACQNLINKSIDKLAEQLEQGYSEAMQRYLKAMSHFHTYSLSNMFLIMSQKPEATHIAGFRTWNKLGRSVNKGEKGIRIFAPVLYKKKKDDKGKQLNETVESQDDEHIMYFRTVCVFDISQTTGDEIPQPSQTQGDATALIPKLEQAITTAGIELEYTNTGKALGKSYKGAIHIKPGMSTAQTFSILAHEYAHELLHQNEEPNEGKTIRELEADAVACIVSEYHGIQNTQSSADYIKLWGGNKEKLLERMERIRECANTIIERIEEQSNKIAKTRPSAYHNRKHA